MGCALLDKSMKLCLWGFLSMLISKSAGTIMSFQRFSLKNAKFKMAATTPSQNSFSRITQLLVV